MIHIKSQKLKKLSELPEDNTTHRVVQISEDIKRNVQRLCLLDNTPGLNAIEPQFSVGDAELSELPDEQVQRQASIEKLSTLEARFLEVTSEMGLTQNDREKMLANIKQEAIEQLQQTSQNR